MKRPRVATLLGLCLCGLGSAAAQGSHWNAQELVALDQAMQRATTWLLDGESESGAFAPRVREDACPVALSAMALWALANTPAAVPADALESTVAYLLLHRAPEGGLFAEASGLRIYTSGVASRALAAFVERSGSDALTEALRELDLFVYRHQISESWVDVEKRGGTEPSRSRSAARELLASNAPGDSAQTRALEFLSQCAPQTDRLPQRLRAPDYARGEESALGPLTYDDVLRFAYVPLRPDHQVALRARRALQAHYTLERNPDLTQRFGPQGFRPGTQGLYYYYHLIARALSTYESGELVLADGRRVDWARDLMAKLISLQEADGSWVNEDARWWENEPVLTTSYSLLALARLRQLPPTRAPHASSDD